MYRYNQDPELPSLKAMQNRVLSAAKNPLPAGYLCYTGRKLSKSEADAVNAYVTTALEPTYFNDQKSLAGLLDRKQQTFVMAAEQWEYVVGLGRYAHPDEAKRFKAGLVTN